jgi:hypothetical protein
MTSMSKCQLQNMVNSVPKMHVHLEAQNGTLCGNGVFSGIISWESWDENCPRSVIALNPTMDCWESWSQTSGLQK